METLLQDLRFAVRMLARKPGFTAVAILALALGIGANTAVFSVVNAVLLRPIHYKNPDRLVSLWNRSPGLNVLQDWLSPAEYIDVRDQNHVFDHVAIARVINFNLTSGDSSERIGGARVSSSLFSLLEASPALGKAFAREDDIPGGPRTVIVSDALWHRRFGADPGLIGKPLILDGSDYVVVGIMPRDTGLNKEILPAYDPVETIDVMTPLPLPAAASRNRDNEDFNVIARLKPDVSPIQAQAEVDTIVGRMRQEYPKNYPPNSGFTISVVPILDQAVGEIRPALLILLGAVALVLLIACANVANLLLSQAATRQKEVAVRTALGAGRLRLIRQFLTESVLLSLAGGSLGLLVGYAAIEVLRVLSPGNIPRAGEIDIDGRVLAFTLAIAFLTGIIFGLVPALRASQLNLNEILKEGGRDSGGGSQAVRARSFLVVAEIALSMILLTGAGLLIRSFMRLQNVNPGFEAKDISTLHLSLTGPPYAPPGARQNFYQQLGERLEKLPGVESVGAVSELPLGGGLAWARTFVEGHIPASGETFIQSDVHVVTPGYFRTMSIPLVKGRYFDEHDTADSLKVAVIDEGFARNFWPDADPIGKRVRIDETPWVTIVGVVADVKQYGLDAVPRIGFYLPYPQYPSTTMYVVMKSASAAGILSAATNEVRALDSRLPVYDLTTMQRIVENSLARRRFSMIMLGAFAVVAIVLAVVGIYGVISYSVTQRTREIGIRMALGAAPADVLKLVVRQGVMLTLAGTGLGLVGAFGLTRLMSRLLYGVSASDPMTFAGVSLVLISVALVADVIPARRAAKVEPMVALRHD